MATQRRFRPSPSMIVATIALIVAAGGSAVAATLITGAQIKDGTVSGADIKNGSLAGIDVKDGSLNIVDLSAKAQAALKGATGPAGPAGAPGAAGTPGAAGSARAWGSVTGGLATFNRVKGFTSVTHPATGIYCLTAAAGIDPATSVLVTSVDWLNSSGSDLLAFWVGGVDTCAAGEFEVKTYDFGPSVNAPALTLSDDVAFVAMVP